MATKYHINPRYRAYGKARIDITRRAVNEQEWQNQWRAPMNDYPFISPGGWQFCFEYKVDDFAAEVGFFIDVLGFTVRAFSPSYAQFTSPGGEICFSVLSAGEGDESTPPDSIRLYLNVDDIQKVSSQLTNRGVKFEAYPAKGSLQSVIHSGSFRSPHGVSIELRREIEEEVLWDEAGDNFDQGTLYDEDTDRKIDELLGLSGSKSHSTEEDEPDLTLHLFDEEPDHAIADVLPEEDDEEDSLGDENQPQDEPVGTANQSKKSSVPWGAERQARISLQSKGHSSDAVPRKGISSWPPMKDPEKVELTYQQVDEELPEDDI